MFYLDPEEPKLIKGALTSPVFYGGAFLVVLWTYVYSTQWSVVAVLSLWGVLLLLSSLVDLKTFILPDRLTYLAWALGGFLPVFVLDVAPLNVLLGSLLGFGVFFLISWGYEKYRGYPGMGFGDVKLLGMLGAWCGATGLPLVLLLSSFIGLFALLGRCWFSKKSIKEPIPFGPSLCAAGWLCVLYQNEIWNGIFYLRLTLSTFIERVLL